MSLLLQTLLGRLTFSMYFWPYPGLLLLCMIASEVWDSETKSTEFVCSRAARKALNIVPEMSSALVRMSLPSSLASRSIYFKEMGCFTTSIWMLYLIRLLSVVTCSQPVHLSVLSLSLVSPMSPPLQSNCNGSATLSTQVQLPCTELHAASWEHKSVMLAHIWIHPPPQQIWVKHLVALCTTAHSLWCNFPVFTGCFVWI